MNERLVRRLGVIAIAVATALPAVRSAVDDTSAQTEAFRAYLPLAGRGLLASDLATPPRPPSTLAATASPVAPTDEPTPAPTDTLVIPPTITPPDTATPTATEPPLASRIFGRITVDGRPLADGFGTPGGPQIELRLCRAPSGCTGDEWEAIDHTLIVGDRGEFEFRSPPPLEEGQRYQVWWVNDFEHVDQATSTYLGRWWSREIPTFAPGDEANVGVFEIGDLKLREICHDCLQSLPITFKWERRSNRAEEYRWSLFRGCGSVASRYGAWRTKSLSHAGQYELSSPPPGFRLNEKYCWYIHIDDGNNGTGWSFDDWRVTFLTTP